MKAKDLMQVLGVIGVVGFAGSLFWWYSYYSDVANFVGAKGLPVECIYTMGGDCGLANRVGHIFNDSPYDPRAFWAAVGLMFIGIIGVFSERHGVDDGLGPRKPGSRRDPTL